MIKGNELRFDNFVLYEGEYKQIKSMWDFDYLYEYEPIPLTEEILLKCGFTATEYYNEFYLSIFDNEFEILVNPTMSYFEFNQFQLKIKHLHQLQNLYFALTGKELEIKL